MKFISKSANLNIILRPGMQAQPLTGTPAVPTIFVKFKDGIAEVDQPELVDLMKKHPGFNQDFIAADDTGTDPYAYLREGADTQYLHEEIKYGHPTTRNASPIQKSLPPELKKMIQDQATEIAKQMLPSMVEAVLKDIATNSKKGEDVGEKAPTVETSEVQSGPATSEDKPSVTVTEPTPVATPARRQTTKKN